MPEQVDLVAVPVSEGRWFPPGAPPLDAALLEAHGIKGSRGDRLWIPAPVGSPDLLAVGVGPMSELSAETFRRLGAETVQASRSARRVAVYLGQLLQSPGEGSSKSAGEMSPADRSRAVIEGALLAAYSFDSHRSRAAEGRSSVEQLVVVGDGAADLSDVAPTAERLAAAVSLARDLVNEPPSSMTPRRFAAVAQEVASQARLEVEVWDDQRIASEGLGGLRGVGSGSHEPPRLVRAHYRPASPRASVALVGKGITFDSGGLSLKTAGGMETMKTDMGGAAAVLAIMSVLADMDIPVEVVGYMALAENMPGGAAIKPGDVLRIRNGKTIEVLNTDAEGRLVLSDALSLAAEQRPDAIVDLATLTGACVMALGREIAGAMGNSDSLLSQVAASSGRTGERTWPLPLPDEYKSHIESEIADMKNIGAPGQAGALSAALLLAEFVDDLPWVHLDIAGPARSYDDKGYVRKGGTGFGVRLLVDFLAHFEKPSSGSSDT